ncbi:ankyrin repeat-containing domain protein [Haematococcus lacustris]
MGASCCKPNPNALLTAAKHGDCARVTALLQGPHTAFVNFAGVRGDTALHLGASQGHADVVQALVGHGGDPRQLNDAGETALHKACLNRHAKVVQLLLQHPKNPVDARRKVDGRSALMLAASAGDASLVNLLLESKAYVNAADARGLTALHLACASGSCDAVMALCEARANCNSVSSEGKTAEDYAAGNKAVLAVLADWTELS